MFKLIIISVAGYFIYKIAKKKVRTMIFGPEQPHPEYRQEIKSAESLIKCHLCERYIDKKSVISNNNHSFCSIDCLESYTKKRG